MSELLDIPRETNGLFDAQRLAAIVEGSDDAIISKTLDGLVTTWNAGATRIFGHSAQEMIGRSIERIIPSDLRAQEREIIARLARGERVEHFETIRLAKDGRRFPISLTVSPLRDAAGKVVGASKIARDISERKRAEELLRVANEEALAARAEVERAKVASVIAVGNADIRTSAILATAVDGIILMDARGTVMMFNPACERIFGYSASEIVGGDVKKLMPSPYRDEHDQYLENHRRTGERKIIGIGREVLGLRKSGETFPMDLSVGEVEVEGTVSYVGILRDVTERKRADEQRERLIEQLTAANEERARFAHAASHDLKEPLRMVEAFGGRLRREYADRLDARGAEYLSLAIEAASRMSRMLEDLVDFERLSVGARGSWFEARLGVDRALGNLDERIREAGASVELRPLPRIFGNPTRFERLMQNLIGNALKYVAPGVAPRVSLSAEDDGEFWRFSVADNGIGIDPRFHDRIFEPFKRLHGRDRYDGSGLGLTICRKIVEGFDGTISVHSSEGGGSIFSFTVRKEREDDEGGRNDA
jgi:PAS domain S-box-containing protein